MKHIVTSTIKRLESVEAAPKVHQLSGDESTIVVPKTLLHGASVHIQLWRDKIFFYLDQFVWEPGFLTVGTWESILKKDIAKTIKEVEAANKGKKFESTVGVAIFDGKTYITVVIGNNLQEKILRHAPISK